MFLELDNAAENVKAKLAILGRLPEVGTVGHMIVRGQKWDLVLFRHLSRISFRLKSRIPREQFW